MSEGVKSPSDPVLLPLPFRGGGWGVGSALHRLHPFSWVDTYGGDTRGSLGFLQADVAVLHLATVGLQTDPAGGREL